MTTAIVRDADAETIARYCRPRAPPPAPAANAQPQTHGRMRDPHADAHGSVADCFGAPPVRDSLDKFMPRKPPPVLTRPSSSGGARKPQSRIDLAAVWGFDGAEAVAAPSAPASARRGTPPAAQALAAPARTVAQAPAHAPRGLAPPAPALTTTAQPQPMVLGNQSSAAMAAQKAKYAQYQQQQKGQAQLGQMGQPQLTKAGWAGAGGGAPNGGVALASKPANVLARPGYDFAPGTYSKVTPNFASAFAQGQPAAAGGRYAPPGGKPSYF